MLHNDPKKRPLQEARLEVTNLNKAGTSTFSLRGNLRISESNHGLRSYLPSLCSLGQRVKKLKFLREPLTSFVKENIAIFCGLLPFTDWSLWKRLFYVLSVSRISDWLRISAVAEFLCVASFKVT